MTTPQAPDEGASAPDQNESDTQRLVGRVLSDRYRVDAVLGVGGMGAVYRAEHLLMHKRVAIKVLHPEMTQLPEAVQRFEREAMAAGRIEHPNVATAYDFGKLDTGAFFMVLEYVEGKSLRDLIDGGPFSLERSVHVVRQILHGLTRAHGLGIVHRDLKPENVMLVERDGDPDFVKMLDFGIAKVTADAPGQKPGGQALTRMGMVYGTPEYMAPEQALGQDVDLRADIYAVGVLFYEMLAGRRPFVASNPLQLLGMVASKPVPTFAEVRPDLSIPPAIEAVVQKLLAKLPEERFQDARSALLAIDAACPPVPLSYVGGSLLGAPLGVPPAVPSAPASLTSSPALDPAVPSSPALDPAGSAPSLPSVDSPLRGSSPEQAGGPLADRRVLLGALGAVGVLLLIVIFLLVRRDPEKNSLAAASASASASASADASAGPGGSASAPGSAAPPAPPAPAVSDDEIAAAKKPADLDALRQKAPRDVRVLRALARAQADARQAEAALKTLGELAEIDAAALGDRAVRAAVVQLAQTEKKPDAVLAFASEKMGAAAFDVYYDLSLSPKASPPLRKKATELLNKGQEGASPALKVVLGLRKSTSVGKTKICSQAKELRRLFTEAKEHGDERALPFLLPMTDSQSCGRLLWKTDCYACLRGGSDLSEAISSIKGRSKG